MIRRRTIVLAALVSTAAACAVPAVATPAQAIALCKADYQCIYWYYSSSTYTTLVGSTYLFCNGTSSTIGQVTGYIRIENDGPCN
jgi:Family of unknown function (DUF6289)